ncbi:MAG: hypothetical protein P8Y54_11770 [Xanthomonadales bacterium]
MKRARPILSALCLLVPAPAFADGAFPNWTVGGLLFGDAYHVPGNHLAAADGDSGFVLRRAYLTLNADFSERFFGRARLEVNQAGDFVNDDFDTGAKDLYVGGRFGRHRLVAGLTATPTFDLVESAWGMRYLARTPLDLQGVPSRDTGLSAQGPLNTSGSLAYRAMWAAPIEFGKDSNGNDRIMGALTWAPSSAWTLDFYADFEQRDGPRDRRTLQAFAAHETETLRWGLLYANADREDAWAVLDLAQDHALFLRIDRLIEPSPKGDGIDYLPFDPSAPATAVFAGWERRLGSHFRLTPNAVVIRYDRDDAGVRPETDVHLRLTLFVDFE